MIGGDDGRLKTGWCDVVADKLKDANSYCSFGFRKGWVKRRCSRKAAAGGRVIFRAQAYCTFSGCSLTCDITGSTEDDAGQHIACSVEFHGEIRHRKGEKRARRIKGPLRKSLKADLLHCSPSTLYNKSMNDFSLDKLLSGNRDGIGGTTSVLQKISSEGRKEERRAEDLMQSLATLRAEFHENSVSAGSRLPGYIQRVNWHPFGVMLYTELGLRIYHYVVKTQALYCDATGTIVKLSDRGKEPAPLYYALVVQHPNGYGPVAVGELITTEHDITSISHFLDCFRRAEASLYGWTNVSTPKQVVIDRSLVLLNSFLRVYNMETVRAYLHRCFRVVNGCASDEDDYHRVFVVACVSHVMNSAKHLCRRLL